MALDRTWYNTLVDDDGSNTVGTLWNKAAVDSLMDATDAEIARLDTVDAARDLKPSGTTSTVTGAQNNWAPTLSGNTLIRWSGASDAAFTGLAGGVTGQVVIVKNTGTAVATFAHQSGSSSAGNKFRNYATSGVTPVAAGGSITYQYDGTDWQLVSHEQGALITPTYAAGNFTASGSMTWTVDSGDVVSYAYRLSGRALSLIVSIATSSVGGTLSGTLKLTTIPGGFTATKSVLVTGQLLDNGVKTTGTVYVLAGQTYVGIERLDGANFTAATNTTGFNASFVCEVT